MELIFRILCKFRIHLTKVPVTSYCMCAFTYSGLKCPHCGYYKFPEHNHKERLEKGIRNSDGSYTVEGEDGVSVTLW